MTERETSLGAAKRVIATIEQLRPAQSFFSRSRQLNKTNILFDRLESSGC